MPPPPHDRDTVLPTLPSLLSASTRPSVMFTPSRLQPKERPQQVKVSEVAALEAQIVAMETTTSLTSLTTFHLQDQHRPRRH